MRYLIHTSAIVVVLTLAVMAVAASPEEKILHSFSGSDGSYPWAGLVSDVSGNLYGTTQYGGAHGQGEIFELTPKGSTWDLAVLHSFSGADGANPTASLIFDVRGNLYGTTAYGGAYNSGTAFELVRGTGWTLNTLFSFGSGDGVLPQGNLAFDHAGNLYGTLNSGGTQNAGAVFELTPSNGRWSRTIIYSFGGSTGSRPWAGVTIYEGNLYGTALYDGPGEAGLGIVFKLVPLGRDEWKYSVIHDFNTGGGGGPFGGVIFDKAGNLYGTTYGEGSCLATVYKLSPQVGTWKLQVAHKFHGADGCQIYGTIAADKAGNLYGTTAEGGKYNAGTVFELVLTNDTYTLRPLHNFSGSPDGSEPLAGVILDTTGKIYGTTYNGGVSNLGTVFEVIP